MADVLRTPDERFKDLPDFMFAPHYLEDLKGYEGLRLHYLDEGPPVEIDEAGHFVQEWGDKVATKAIEAFK